MLRKAALGALAAGLALIATPAFAQYTTHYVWDAARRLTMEIEPDPDGVGPLKRPTTKYTYDVDGKLTKTEVGTSTSGTGTGFTVLETTTYSYDLVGRRVKEVSPGGVEQASYDAAGRTTCVATRMNPAVYASLPASACDLGTAGGDGPDRINRATYDAAGQVTSIERAVGTASAQTYAAYTYTANGKQQTITDARANRSTLTYDGHDRLARLNYPSTTVGAATSSATDYESYGYDMAGNRTSVRKRDGKVIGYAYDALNRETLKDIPDETARDIYTSYDLSGQVLTQLFGSTSGQGIVATYDKAGRMTSETTFGRTVGYEYDKAGNRTKVIWPDAFAAQYSYDTLNRTTAVDHTSGGSMTGLSTFAYDDLARRTKLTHANGVVTDYGYDTASRLTSLTHDPAGTTRDIGWTFGYNPASQLKTWTSTNTAYSWASSAPPSTSNAYDGLNRDAAIAAVAGGYDLRGNLKEDGSRSFDYDVENRLVSATEAGLSLTLTYDPLGRLWSTSYNGVTTLYLYDGGDLIGEYQGSSNAPLRRYIHGPGMDEPLAWFEGADTSDRRWFQRDRMGSVVGWAPVSGVISEVYSYGPWGEPGQNGWTGSRFRYTGQIALPEARLYYYRGRVYDPESGRFLQTDPIGYADDLNLYAYVGNDPLNATDPYGLSAWCMACNANGALDTKEDPKPEETTVEKVEVTAKRKDPREGRSVAMTVLLGLIPGFDLYECARYGCSGVDWAFAAAGVVPFPAAKGLTVGRSVAKGALKAAARACNCFAAGTLVETERGYKAIETIRVGDLVRSRNDETGETAFRPVVGLLKGEVREIWAVTIQLDGGQPEIIRATADHPFMTAEGDWVSASDLLAGSRLQTAAGAVATVTALENTGAKEPTYNFEVAEFHTYFVGRQGVWVHNAACAKSASKVWKGFKGWRGKTKTDGDRLFEWDHTHNEIEVYNKRGEHLGVMDPETGEMIKPAVAGRTINVR